MAQRDILLLDSYQLSDVCRIMPGFTSSDSARTMEQVASQSKVSFHTPKMLDFLIEYY